MNHELRLEEVDRQLAAWGRWLRHRNEPAGTGFAPASPVHMVMTYGTRIDRAHDNGREETARERRCRGLHDAIEAMPEPLQVAVLLRYAIPGKEKDKPRQGGLRPDRYRQFRRDALLWLAGWMQGAKPHERAQ